MSTTDNRPWIPAKVQSPEIGRMVQVRYQDGQEGVGMLCMVPGGYTVWFSRRAEDRYFQDQAQYAQLSVSDWRLMTHIKDGWQSIVKEELTLKNLHP